MKINLNKKSRHEIENNMDGKIQAGNRTIQK
jgi:hypothetical protein